VFRRSRLFRRLFLTALQKAFDAGQFRFAGALQALIDPHRFADRLQPARQTEWVVYAKRPCAGPRQVLDYVGRYTHRVAIANQRLLDVDDGHVRFRYTDYRAPAAPKTMTLDVATMSPLDSSGFETQSAGRRARSFLRFAHTGEYFGLAGQTVGGLVSAVGAVLVYTGLALSLRRFLAWLRRRGRP
jgi:uncharacterized iron-regulated membrane protein